MIIICIEANNTNHGRDGGLYGLSTVSRHRPRAPEQPVEAQSRVYVHTYKMNFHIF